MHASQLLLMLASAFAAYVEDVGVSRSFPCMFVVSFYVYTYMLAFF